MSKAVAKKEAQLPAYLQNTGPARGSENVTNDDVEMPRINLIQDLSPQKDKDDEKHIEGAEVGMMFNTLTGQLFNSINFTPIMYNTRWMLAKDQATTEGGVLGIFDTESEAQDQAAHLVAKGEETAADMEVVKMAEHFILLDDGTEIMLSMKKSQNKVARKFNSMVKLAGGDRFGRRYLLTSYRDQNKNGKKYYNYKITPATEPMAEGVPAQYPSEDIYKKAVYLYEEIKKGLKKVKTNYSEEKEITGKAEF